jgi:nucleoside-diphosphate-sugar epimerase
MQPPRKLFIFGLGYSALAFARRVRVKGWRIAGTTRDAAKAAALREQGIDAHLLARGLPLADAGSTLAGTTHLLASAPPDATGDPVLAHHAGAIAAVPSLRWAGYLSTTGVYGDRGGERVDERDGLHPTSARGRARVQAEHDWLDLLRLGVRVHIFRLAGIYGPGRSAFDALRDGTARRIVKPGQVFSRIHVDDIVQVLETSIAKPDPGAVYNVCDDEAAPPQDVIAYAAALLGQEPPPEISYDVAAPSMSEMARSFYRDNKRVANLRIKHELGVKLRYPDYRAGLAAILASESSSAGVLPPSR